MVQPDPWNSTANDTNSDTSNGILSTNVSQQHQFEDNFQPAATTDGLPDSKEYLQSLERKLQKLKKDATVLEQLKARREHCMENLLQGNLTLHDSQSEDLQRLEEEFEDSRTRDIARYLIPEQAVSSSELLHIINHDHLEVEVEQPKPSEDTQGDCPSQ